MKIVARILSIALLVWIQACTPKEKDVNGEKAAILKTISKDIPGEEPEIKQIISDTYPLATLVKNITSSSTLVEKSTSNFSYHPTNIYDMDHKTAWFEGVEGNGVGEYFEMEFFTPINIFSITISNGYAKSESLFDKNGSIKELEVITRHGHQILELQKTYKPQKFVLELKNVTSIKFVIKSVYPGEEYSDTGISEIQIENILSTTLQKNVSDQELELLLNQYASGFPEDDRINLIFADLTQDQLKKFLSNTFDSLKNKEAEYHRQNILMKHILKNQNLIPVVLKSALGNHKSIFHHYVSGGPIKSVKNSYVGTAKKYGKITLQEYHLLNKL